MTRPLRDARIGWGSYSADFAHPGDRRRFGAYAAERGLSYERADLDRPYDLALVTPRSDLPAWTVRKRRQGHKLKLVLELIDSYFVETNPVWRLIKGTARYALGTDSRLSPDYLKTLIRACEAADAVICSTLEQQETIRRYNRNVHLSFDWFGGDLGAPKSDFSRRKRLRIVWEGQAVTLKNLSRLREPLNDLKDNIELHVVTDPVLHRWFGQFGARASAPLLEGIEVPKTFYAWERQTFSDLITGCDVAVIPINTGQAMMRGKPENKLILLWQLAMPVLTGASPAYERAMAAAGLDLVCRTPAEWGARIERMIQTTPSELEAIGRQGYDFAYRAYSKDAFAAQFDRVFASIGFTV